MIFEVNQYDWDGGILFKRKEIEFKPGITILVGCNGSGKTTLMHQIEYKYRSDNDHNASAKLFSCCDTHNEMSYLLEFGQTEQSTSRLVSMMSSSEGERIAQGLVSAFNWMWNRCKNKDVKNIFMLLDSLDSGLDISNLRMIYGVLEESVDIAKNDFSTNLYVIMSANDYALVENHNCLDIYTGEKITFKDFDEYSTFVMKSNDIKENRYNEESNSNEDEQDYDSWSER